MIPQQKPKVLVVDDEPAIVDVVSAGLRYAGFIVSVAGTGRRALALAQEDPPDLMVLDAMLSELDGIEIVRRLRADGIRVPVIYLTARDTLQDKVAELTVSGPAATLASVEAARRGHRLHQPPSGRDFRNR